MLGCLSFKVGKEKPLPKDSSAIAYSSLRRRTLLIFRLALSISSSYFIYFFCSFFISRQRGSEWKNRLHRKNALKFKTTTLVLKGLLIKVGQFMSARVDILPEAYTSVLSLLQDQVTPANYDEIKARLTKELGAAPETVFEVFDVVPIASASLGQVHRATLKRTRKADSGPRPSEHRPLTEEAEGEGTELLTVAVKVQYPGIEAIVKTDLEAIRLIVSLLKRVFPNIRFDVLMDEFSRIVHQELNYVTEGRRAEQFYENFESDERIVVPKVIWSHTTSRVLTLEFVDGIKISQIDQLEKAGIDKGEVATLLVESYMKQILKHRFFHGDPHPGNLFVQKGPRLVFVDFGLMQAINIKMHQGIQLMIMAIIDRDIPAISKSLFDLGFISRAEKMESIEKMVSFFMDRYRDLPPRSYQDITIAHIAEDFKILFKVYPGLQIPNHFILVGRTAGMLNGLCSQLAPELNMIELAKPHAKRFIASADWSTEFFSKGKELVTTLLALPGTLKDFLDYANSGQFRTLMHSEALTSILTKIYTLAFRTVLVLWVLGVSFLYQDRVGDVMSLISLGLGTLIIIPSLVLITSFLRWR